MNLPRRWPLLRRMTPIERSWRYRALVTEYNRSLGRLAAIAAEHKHLAFEHTHLIKKLHEWRKEKEKTGRITSIRQVLVSSPSDLGVHAFVSEETHNHLRVRMVSRKNGGSK